MTDSQDIQAELDRLKASIFSLSQKLTAAGMGSVQHPPMGSSVDPYKLIVGLEQAGWKTAPRKEEK